MILYYSDNDLFYELLDRHLALRPAMQVQDIYKLLYQGVLGPEHLVASQPAFEQRLQEEYADLEADESEPLLESIHPQHALARLNLRPYKAQSGDLSGLAQVCLATARQTWGTLDELQQAWDLFASACQAGRIPSLPSSEAITFSNWLEAHSYPPVHHSEAYRRLYRPAYRLVNPELFESNLSIPALD